MAVALRSTFASLCRRTRADLDISQRELAAATGLSRGYLASIELGRANPSLGTVERIADALGIELDLIARPPIILGDRQRDILHAWASGYVDRRIRAASWETAREVELAATRARGWIDLLAFNPRNGLLVIIEVKTRDRRSRCDRASARLVRAPGIRDGTQTRLAGQARGHVASAAGNGRGRPRDPVES